MAQQNEAAGAARSSSIQTILSVPESHRFSAKALADFIPPVGNYTLP